MPRSPIARILVTLVCLDAVFTTLLGYSYLVMMNIDGAARGTAIGAFVVIWVAKLVVWIGSTAARLRPLARWTAGPHPPEDAKTVLEVAAAAYRTPFTVALSWGALFAAMWIVGSLVLYLGFAETVPLGPRALEATVFVAVGLLFGATEFAFPLVERLLAPFIEHVSLTAHERRIEIPGRGLTFRGRLVAFALALVLAPSLYLAGVAYMNDARGSERELVHRAELAAAEAAFGYRGAARAVDGWVFTFNPSLDHLEGREAIDALAARPALTRAFERAVREAPTGSASHPRDGAIAFRPHGDERIGVVIPGAAQVSIGTVVLLILFLVIVAMWGPASALFIAGSTAIPVVRISEALARVGDGQVANAPKVPVFHQDEVGTLAKTYNAMVDQLRELASRATEVSNGALDIELEVRGELGDAFRGQLTSLRDIVGHIARSAAQLAGAASEMYAAAQEQEAAAHQQSVGIEEVSRTMESLLAAATHVTESTTGVLHKAERTRETTTRTAERITELSAHASRIGEILETIREIADRSDLLALNASLEGTRAGEAGRGFALVAGEMRKLAERVTASVGDIKKLVSDVRASVSATVIATEESSKLAEGTTESARQINLVTQQQRSGTEQAGQSMRDVASMITQSLAATQQIRSLAEDLKGQAENLTGLVAKFRLPGPRKRSVA